MNYRVIEKLEKEYPFFNLTVELPKNFYLSKDIKNYCEIIETTKDSYFIHGRQEQASQHSLIILEIFQKKVLVVTSRESLQ